MLVECDITVREEENAEVGVGWGGSIKTEILY